MAVPVERHEDSGHGLTADQARQAVALGHMRYVLAISTLAVTLIFASMLVFGA